MPEDPPTTWRLTGRRKHLFEERQSISQIADCLLSQLLSSCLTSKKRAKKVERSTIKKVRVVGPARPSFLPPCEAQPVDLPKSACLAFPSFRDHHHHPAIMEVFIFPRPLWLSWLYDSDILRSFSNLTNLPSLHLHIHHVLGALLVYHTIFLFISPILSTLLLPNIYPKFNKRTRINWDVHVVSFVQSSFICTFALWVMYTDTQRAAWRSQDEEGMIGRVFGYTAASGAVQGYAAGYFLWDLVMSAWYLEIFGPGFLAHAASAVAVYNLGFVSSPRAPVHVIQTFGLVASSVRTSQLTPHSAHSSISTPPSLSSLNSPRHSSISIGSATRWA